MALTYTESGNNTASTSWAVSHPAASSGDLLIFNIGWDDSTTTTGLTPPSGPNGETAVVVEDVRVSSNTSVRGKIVYYKATGSWSASTISFTPSASEQWSAVVVKVPSGEFDATTPIGADNYFESTTTDSTPDLPSLTAGSTDGGGTVVGFMVGDVDDADGTITGWTSRASTDRGAIGVDLWTRDTTATDSESIPAATGATYPSARDYVSFIYIVRPNQPPTVALNTPADAASISDTTPTLDFTGTDAEGNDVRYEVQVGSDSSFGSTNSGATNPSTIADDSAVGTITWASTSNATVEDGSEATASNNSPNSTATSHYLKATNFGFSIPGTATILGIKIEIKRRVTGTGASAIDSAVRIVKADASIGSTNKGDLVSSWPGSLAYATYGGSSDLWGESWKPSDINDSDFGAAVAVAVTMGPTFTAVARIDHIKITVYYDNPLLYKVSGGSATTDTITSTQNWTVPVGVYSITVEAWGAGGGGGGDTTTGGYGGGGGAGGGYSKSTGISVTPGTSYSVVVGTGGAGGANAASPGVGGTGGDSTFNSTTVVAKGGTGGAGGTSGGAAGGTGGASGSGTGATKTSGGDGGIGATLGGGGAGGSGGDSTGGGTGGNATTANGGTAGSAGTTNGAAGGAGGNSGGNGTAGTAPGGGGGGSGNSIGSETAAAGARGQVSITYTPGDSGFANPDNGGDTDPFTSGDNIQFTVQAGDALATGTYYWRVRGIDPSGSNAFGAWSSTRSFTVTSGGAVFTYIPQRMRRGMGA